MNGCYASRSRSHSRRRSVRHTTNDRSEMQPEMGRWRIGWLGAYLPPTARLHDYLRARLTRAVWWRWGWESTRSSSATSSILFCWQIAHLRGLRSWVLFAFVLGVHVGSPVFGLRLRIYRMRHGLLRTTPQNGYTIAIAQHDRGIAIPGVMVATLS